MRRLIVGNWKMNLNNARAEILIERLRLNIVKPTAEIVICPSFTILARIFDKIQKWQDKNIFLLGAQNTDFRDEGAFTGEISPVMLKDYVKYCIVGHSERRIYFGETNEIIAQKMSACLRHNIKPILCVGENLHQRQEGMAKRTVLDQLEENLSEITPTELTKVTIAYEPVWAIGSGELAKPLEVEDMSNSIRTNLINKYGEPAKQIRLLYGGSVDSDNAKAYLSLEECSGLLVGGSSLNYKEFSKICQL